MQAPDLITAGYDCPVCGERNELLIDPTGGEKQEFVEDCAVCCNPLVIAVRLVAEGGAGGRGRLDGLELASLTVEPES